MEEGSIRTTTGQVRCEEIPEDMIVDFIAKQLDMRSGWGGNFPTSLNINEWLELKQLV